MQTYGGRLTKQDLRRARPENVRRLARALHLRVDDMSDRQVVKLVWWRLRKLYRPELCQW